MEQRLVATTARLVGTAIGLLTTALGLWLLGSPWEFHLGAHPMAAVALAGTGVTAALTGVVLSVDLINETRGLRRRR